MPRQVPETTSSSARASRWVDLPPLVSEAEEADIEACSRRPLPPMVVLDEESPVQPGGASSLCAGFPSPSTPPFAAASMILQVGLIENCREGIQNGSLGDGAGTPPQVFNVTPEMTAIMAKYAYMAFLRGVRPTAQPDSLFGWLLRRQLYLAKRPATLTVNARPRSPVPALCRLPAPFPYRRQAALTLRLHPVAFGGLVHAALSALAVPAGPPYCDNTQHLLWPPTGP